MTQRPTRVLTVDRASPEADVLKAAAAVVRAGGLVAFPTETVYGLGASALVPAAVRAIFDAKGRPATNPLIVHVADEVMARQIVAAWPDGARALAAHFWPGPLTLVLPKAEAVPSEVTGGGGTVAVRVPAHAVALGLIRAAGVPLAAPSANRSSHVSPTRAEHVLTGLNGRIDLILDGGPTPNGIESTVLDLTTHPAVLLRPGPVPVAALEEVVGPVVRWNRSTPPGPLPSPGLQARHYAPRTPVELHRAAADVAARAAELQGLGEDVVAVLIGARPTKDIVSMPADPGAYAARLYEVLHDLDARGLTRILIELPPDRDEWLAVRDRLTRAAVS